MHSQPMSESQGEFQDDWKHAVVKDAEGNDVGWPCRKCDGRNVYYKEWESSCGGYEDMKYECRDCKRTWWVEGADS